MAPKSFTLRPGLLVALSTTMTGNVKYQKDDATIEKDGKGELASWRTDRSTLDKAEHQRAKEIRSAAVYTVQKVCVPTGKFGFLCPAEHEDRLYAAINEANDMIDAFNRSAKVTRLSIDVMTARIEPENPATIRTITRELRELGLAMKDGATPEAIRQAAGKAQSLAAMLCDSDAERVSSAVDKARKTARSMVRGEVTPSVVVIDDVVVPEPAVVAATATPTEPATMSDNEKALAALRQRKAQQRAARRVA